MSSEAPVAAATAAPAPTWAQWVSIIAVLLGTFISTLTGRLSNFGLNDIRGGVHAGFDEGAWITTAQTTAQMLVTYFAMWFGNVVYGPRRVLLVACGVFAISELLLPFSPGLGTLLGLQFVSGLASGCFIPLTLPVLLLTLPPRLWPYGIALYGLNIEFSLHISAALEGWYVEHASWHWIFWQNVPLSIAMALCLLAMPRRPPAAKHPPMDTFGLASVAVGLSLIYAALDQGNRLDWTHSGLVWGLMLGGVVMLVAFFVHLRVAANPWLDLKAAFAPPLPLAMLLVGLVRLAVLSTAYLIPQYLTTVRGFRALQVGDTLNWIALPQLLVCPLTGYFISRTDPRIASAFGFCCIGGACLWIANNLTPLWGSDQFLSSQLVQSIGQSLALSGIVYAGILHLRLEVALTFGAVIQTARLIGGEIGTAFITTWQRVREQRASNLIGMHLTSGDPHLMQRLEGYARVLGRTLHADPQTGAAVLLARAVRVAANTQAVIDGFYAIAASTVVALLALSLFPLPKRGP